MGVLRRRRRRKRLASCRRDEGAAACAFDRDCRLGRIVSGGELTEPRLALNGANKVGSGGASGAAARQKGTVASMPGRRGSQRGAMHAREGEIKRTGRWGGGASYVVRRTSYEARIIKVVRRAVDSAGSVPRACQNWRNGLGFFFRAGRSTAARGVPVSRKRTRVPPGAQKAGRKGAVRGIGVRRCRGRMVSSLFCRRKVAGVCVLRTELGLCSTGLGWARSPNKVNFWLAGRLAGQGEKYSARKANKRGTTNPSWSKLPPCRLCLWNS